MDKQVKAEIIAKYATHEGDTGSPEVQILKFTPRIIIRAADFCKW